VPSPPARFYEVGSGLESKKDYVFVEVTPGQGAWSWIDQNANGIKEVVEYVPAIFQDTAKYIRVYIPTNEFIKVYTTQFSEAININPRVLWANKKGALKFLSRLSNQFVYSIDRKIQRTDLLLAFDPFFSSIADTSLVTLTSSFEIRFSSTAVVRKLVAIIPIKTHEPKHYWPMGLNREPACRTPSNCGGT
jgi:hypothetical protein